MNVFNDRNKVRHYIATLVISRFVKNLSCQQTKIVKTIFQYFKRSKNTDITNKGQNKLFLKGYSNFKYVDNKNSQKSIFDHIFILNRRPVS